PPLKLSRGFSMPHLKTNESYKIQSISCVFEFIVGVFALSSKQFNKSSYKSYKSSLLFIKSPYNFIDFHFLIPQTISRKYHQVKVLRHLNKLNHIYIYRLNYFVSHYNVT